MDQGAESGHQKKSAMLTTRSISLDTFFHHSVCLLSGERSQIIFHSCGSLSVDANYRTISAQGRPHVLCACGCTLHSKSVVNRPDKHNLASPYSGDDNKWNNQGGMDAAWSDHMTAKH